VPGTLRPNLTLLELPPALGARLGVRDASWSRFGPLEVGFAAARNPITRSAASEIHLKPSLTVTVIPSHCH
jgi:hypothetical protein